MQGKSEDDNAAMRTLYLRAFARNSDDCYKDRFERERLRFRTEHICQILRACLTSQRMPVDEGF